MLNIFSCAHLPSLSSLEKCLLRSSAQFLIGFFPNSLSCMSYLYILNINPLSVRSFANTFPPFHGISFHFVTASFAVQKLLSLFRSHLFIFAFYFFCLGRLI